MADALASHDSLFAAAPVTMESLYDRCCQLLAIEPAEEYFTAFGTDEAGVMVSCEATLDSCVDGCVGDGGSIYLGQVGFGSP